MSATIHVDHPDDPASPGGRRRPSAGETDPPARGRDGHAAQDAQDAQDGALRDLADRAAGHLGAEWQLDRTRPVSYRGVNLTHPDGRTLHLARGRDTRRLVITGVLPVRAHSGPRPSITVRADRGPAVLAREIMRRLLPAYDAAHARAQQVLSALAAARESRDAVARTMDIPGTIIISEESSTWTTLRWHTPTGRDVGDGTVRFWTDSETADLTLRRIPGPLALAIARLIATSRTDSSDRRDAQPGAAGVR